MLYVNNINVFIGAVHILWDISLRVNEGEVVVLLGSNGHGKTTILKTISGLLRPTSGYIKFNGTRLDKLPPYKIVEMGIIQVPEGGQLFPMMTVMENLKLGAYPTDAWKHHNENLKRVFQMFPILEERKNQIVWTLSGGERRMVALGRGLMSRAKLLMIDEPSLGLAPAVAQEVFKRIRDIKKMGISLLLVEQNIKYVSELADRIYLIENGRVALEGGRDEVLSHEYLKEAYLGKK